MEIIWKNLEIRKIIGNFEEIWKKNCKFGKKNCKFGKKIVNSEKKTLILEKIVNLKKNF